MFRPLVSNDEIGRSLFTTPNVPPERVAALRSAFQAMIADPEFQADAQRRQLPLATKSGEELQTIVNAMFDISPDALSKLRELVK
jgi:tripartite-type tricarboxylate transporter receptor subunit TctC